MYGVVVCIHTYSLTSKGENLIITRVRVSSSVRRKSISHGQSAATETNISLTLGYTQHTSRRSKPACLIAMSNPHLLDTVRLVSLMLKGFSSSLYCWHYSSVCLKKHQIDLPYFFMDLLVYMPCTKISHVVKGQKKFFPFGTVHMLLVPPKLHLLCILCTFCIYCMVTMIELGPGLHTIWVCWCCSVQAEALFFSVFKWAWKSRCQQLLQQKRGR